MTVPEASTVPSPREESAYTLGVQALLWEYPLVCYARTSGAGVRLGASGYNSFVLHTELKTAADRYVVTPNNVTLDGYAALDLREEPVVVYVPALTDPRWYIVQIGDAFDEVVTSVGGIKGPRAGSYVVCGPDYRGELPGDMTMIRTRTSHAVVAARVFVNGAADADAAADLLRQFHVIPLSGYLRDGLQYAPETGRTLPDEHSDAGPLQLFERLGQAMRWILPVADDTADPLVSLFHQVGLSVAHGFDASRLDEEQRRGLARAAVAAEAIIDARWADLGETTNGWRYNMSGGRAGHDLPLRAALAKNAIGTQLATEVLYPNTTVDSTGAQLDGGNTYELHFPAGQLPPVAVFWNMSMYGEDMLFVENDLGRYSIGSTTDGLTPNGDGSLTITISHERPTNETAAATWLPAPEGPFNLTRRFYGPSSSVLDGSYRLPAVTRAA